MSHQSLEDLTNVAGSPADGKILKYNSGVWGPADESAGGGGSKPDITASSSNTYTITTHTGIEEVFLMSPTSTATITLTRASDVGAGYKYQIKLLTAQTLTVTREGTTTDTIDGATTFALSAQYASVTIMSDGNNWHII